MYVVWVDKEQEIFVNSDPAESVDPGMNPGTGVIQSDSLEDK